jgi:hypothetical protein
LLITQLIPFATKPSTILILNIPASFLTRPKQYGLVQGGVAMNSSFQINICHGTFLENLSYWVLILISIRPQV